MKRYTWQRKRPRSTCARGSIRTVKRGRVAVRVCCPKGPGHWKRGRCTVGLRAYEVGTPKLAGGVTIPRAHLREDIREAQKMIRELKSGIARDRKALR